MQRTDSKARIAVLGCGAIGSRIARSVQKELKEFCQLSGLYDHHDKKAIALANEFSSQHLVKSSLTELLRDCDLMVEAVNAQEAHTFVRQALLAEKNVLAMSVGRLLNAQDLFELAARQRRSLLIPSGAIAGIDAIKAASLVSIRKITLTTRKPPSGFGANEYLQSKGIDLSRITAETVIFDGDVDTAVKYFPQNINVAATLALASRHKDKINVRIITSPEFQTNSHEIELEGDFGRIITRTENVPCPDNPKTSYLAVLSGIQTLKEFCQGIRIGT